MALKGTINNLTLAKNAAIESGKFLLREKDKLVQRTNSNTKDVKLKADIESENIIKSIIASQSSYPILAEESGKSLENLGDIFWVIDPLDGTANYSRNIPICCVSIGLVKNMKPLLGVIYDFDNDHLYSGNTLENISEMNNLPINVSDKSDRKESILITGLPHDTDYSYEALSNMIEDMQTWQKIRMLGSAAMAACYIATGKADFYHEKGIYLWDIIAGAAIVKSAGGTADIFNYRENFQVDVVFSNSKVK
jgi:myo-inositol-1(or 4)-monophosphatase